MSMPQFLIDFSYMLALLTPLFVVAAGFPLAVEIVQWLLDIIVGGIRR